MHYTQTRKIWICKRSICYMQDYQKKFQFVFGQSMETWIRLVRFSLLKASLNFWSKSAAFVWLRNWEVRYLVEALFSSLSQNRRIKSICSFWRALSNDSSNEITYFLEPEFFSSVSGQNKGQVQSLLVESSLPSALKLLCYLAVWEHFGK